HTSFLRYTVEQTLAGAGGELKEYTIAAEVYGKSASYDPSVDSIVRVEAARLRSKLLEYYATRGSDDPVRIDLPKGTYTPVFIVQGPPAAVEQIEVPVAETAVSEPVGRPHHVPFRRATIAGAVLLAAAILLLGWRVMSRPYAPDTLSSIAVLSFVSLSPDPEVEAIAAGLTEDISNVLSRSRN